MHGTSKIIDTFETYQGDRALLWCGLSVTDPELPFGLLKAPDA